MLEFPKYLDINKSAYRKQYNHQDEMYGYLLSTSYEADSFIYEVYWFLERIDLGLHISLKERI